MGSGIKRFFKTTALALCVPLAMQMALPDLADSRTYLRRGGGHRSVHVYRHGHGRGGRGLMGDLFILGSVLALGAAIENSKDEPPPPPPQEYSDDDCLGGGCDEDEYYSDEDVRLSASAEEYWQCPKVNLASGIIEFGVDNYATETLPEDFPYKRFKMTKEGKLIDPKHPKLKIDDDYIIYSHAAWKRALEIKRQEQRRHSYREPNM